jgi:uncharacterized sulfatase
MRDGFGFNYTRRSKRSPFEDGLRTPILFSLSGRTRSQTHDLLCSSVDVVPTILDACSIEAPDALSGRSLWPLVTGEVKALNSEPVFGAIYPGDASVLGDPAVDVAYRWIRSGDFKLIVPHPKDGKVWGDYGNLIQLYNLAEDPNETENLASDPRSRPTVDRLHVMLDRWWSAGGEIKP